MTKAKMKMKVGLCGFTINTARYYELFPVVEVQQTFYQPPQTATMHRWRTSAPPQFEFTMKAWQLITHRSTSTTYRRLKSPLTDKERAEAGGFRNTDVVERAWQATLACQRILRATMILFQCPASFRPTEENVANMRSFFARIERPKKVRLLWEPRGDWPDDLLIPLCNDLDLTHVVDPFLRDTVTPQLTYWRLHGVTGAYHVYSDDELRSLRSRIDPKNETYVMFNNVPRVGDAERFMAEGPER